MEVDFEGAVLLQPLLDSEHFEEAARHDTTLLVRVTTGHGVRLTRASLAIRKDAHIEAVDGRLDEHASVIKDLVLRGLRAEARIKHKLLHRVLALHLLNTLTRCVHLLLLLDSDAQRELVKHLDGVNAAQMGLA